MKQILFFTAALMFTFSVINGQEKVIEKSFDGIESIKLNTAAGDCDIEKASGNSVKVVVKYTYDDDEFEAKMEVSGSSLIMEEKFHGNNVRGSSSWKLSVPDGLSIKFNTGSGDLQIADLKVNLGFNSGSGDGELENVEGDLKCNSGSGDFKLTNVNGSLKINSGSGDHSIKNCTASGKINTGSGDVELNSSEGGYKLNSGSGDVSASDLKQTDTGGFNSGSGDVSVQLAAPLNNDINVNSGSGDALLDYNGNKIEGMITMKAKKKGGEIRAPFKFDKEEEVNEGGGTYLKKTVKFGTKDIEVKIGTGTGRAEIKE